MSTLFETDEAPALLATPEQVRELSDRFSFRKDVVSTWTRERAVAELGKQRRDELRTLSRAAARARAEGAEEVADALDPGALPTAGDWVMQQNRDEVRAALQQARAAADPEELLAVVQSAAWVFTKEEVHEYAGVLIAQLTAFRVLPDPHAPEEPAS